MFGAGLRAALDERPVLGTFVKLPRAEVIDTLALAGLDFAVLDLEHSQVSYAEAREALLAARANGFPLLVRLPSLDAGLVNRLLEAGAAGIQLSDTTAAEQAARLRSSIAYAPQGTRSISLAQPAAGYGSVGLVDYLERSAGATLAVGQLESVDYDDGFDAIMQHLDVAFIGPTDLSVSAGTPGDVGSGTAAGVVERIEYAAGRTGTPLGVWAPTPEAAHDAIERGYRYVVVASDLALLSSTAMRTVARFAERAR